MRKEPKALSKPILRRLFARSCEYVGALWRRQKWMALCAAAAATTALTLMLTRQRREARGSRLALELARKGFVHVRGCSRRRKRWAWTQWIGQVNSYWQKVLPSFELSKPESWPVIENGRAYAFTYKGFGYPVRIWRDNAEALRTIRAFVGRGAVLHAEDNGWGIVNFPHPTHRGPTPRHAHVDDGRNSSFRDRSPINGYDLFTRQTALALYCCTPGDLTPETGATVLYPGSHLLILALLQRRSSLQWQALQAALKAGALRELATTRPVIPEDQMIIVCGPLVHGTAYCEQPMHDNLPRVIMNPKLFADALESDVSSLLSACVREPRTFWPRDDLATFDKLLDNLDRATAQHEWPHSS